MGGAAADAQVVTADGVTVRKRLNREHPEHLAVLFEIRSERADAARVRVRDSVPSSYRIGFHPDFGGQHWTTTDDGVAFDRTFEPDETYETAYAVGDATAEKVNSLSVEPVVDVSPLEEQTDSPETSSEQEPGPEPGLLETEDFDLSLDAGSGEQASRSEVPDLGFGTSDQPDAATDGSSDLDAADIDGPEPDQQSGAGPTGKGTESVRVTEPGVVVEKRLDQDKFSFPAVVFEITSSADRPIPVRIKDRVPEAVDPDDIAFHHRYGDDHWERTDQQVRFERDVDAGEEYTTLYAVRGLPPASEEAFLEEPTVTTGEDPETAAGGPETVDGSDSNETSDEHDDEDGGVLADLFSTDVSEPDPASQADSASPSATADSGTATGESAADEEFVADVSDSTDGGGPADAVTNQEASEHAPGATGGDTGTGQSGWVSARFMERTSKLETTVGSLAESMQAHQAAIADVQDEITAIRAEFNTARETLDGIESQVTDIASAIDDFETPGTTKARSADPSGDSENAAVSQLQGTVSDLAEEVSLLKQSLASELETAHQLRTDLDAVGSEVGEVGDAAQEAAERTVSIDEALASQQSLLETTVQTLEELDSQQAELRNTTETLNENLHQLASRIDEIEESIDD